MRDFMYGLLGALLGGWILERLPQLALAIVRLAARLMPTVDLREQMRDDWTADAMTADGPLSMLIGSLSTLASVPSIRQAYGYKPVPISVDLDAVIMRITKFSTILGLFIFLVAQIYMLICRKYVLPNLNISKHESFTSSLSELSSSTLTILFLALLHAALYRAFLQRIRKRSTR